MAKDSSVSYSLTDLKTTFRDFERSLIDTIEHSRRPEERSKDFVYGGFVFSSVPTKERGGDLELRVDVVSLSSQEDAGRLLGYTRWFKDWEIFEPNNSGINMPESILRLLDLKELKAYIGFSESKEEPKGMVKIYYSLKKPFLEEKDNSKKRRAWRVLVIAPIKAWIDKTFPERIFR